MLPYDFRFAYAPSENKLSPPAPSVNGLVEWIVLWMLCRRVLSRSASSHSLHSQLQAGGLHTTLATEDFGCWDAAVASTLGHHCSALLDAAESFKACFRMGQLGDFSVLHLHGRGRLRLHREQCGRSLLWLPLHGLSEERVNGEAWLAEPGQALLFHPGDALLGETSADHEGLSILLPEELDWRPARPAAPLLNRGPLQQAVLRCARHLAAAAAARPIGAEHTADRLHDALHALQCWQEQPHPRERITARRRRAVVDQACGWMAERLAGRFTLQELSDVVAVSPRQLQYSFLEELGISPMAEAKRLRLQRLRGLLLDPEQRQRSVAELMAACGLIASGVTAADYRRWCGESPRETRRRRL